MRKMICLLLVVCSLVFSSQAAFANGTPRFDPIQWTSYTYNDEGIYKGCSNKIQTAEDGYVSARGTIAYDSSYKTSCSIYQDGVTYVENLNQITIDWTTYVYNNPDWAELTICGGNSISIPQGYGSADGNCFNHRAFADTASVDDEYYGTLVIDVAGYSGPIEFWLGTGASYSPVSGSATSGESFVRINNISYN
ncbi:hypothetical protein [Paenibacillus sp. y28]|uniref:hypothetical protein n=1 Tax=Paenibacillus sp. y28 TaxID=3129110 RepID=UPI00301B3500